MDRAAKPSTGFASTAIPAEHDQNSPVWLTLERIKARSDAANLQRIYDELRRLGYVPHAPRTRASGKQPDSYLRWTDPDLVGPAVIYLTAADFWIAGQGNP